MKPLAALVVFAMILLPSGCATTPGKVGPGSATLDFALIGDMPYDGRQEKEFVQPDEGHRRGGSRLRSP